MAICSRGNSDLVRINVNGVIEICEVGDISGVKNCVALKQCSGRELALSLC